MEFFADSNSWEFGHGTSQLTENLEPEDTILGLLEPELNAKLPNGENIADHIPLDSSNHISSDHYAHDTNSQRSPEHVSEHVPRLHELNDQYFSPALSFEGTPMMSPHSIAPHVPTQHHHDVSYTPQGTPQGTPQLTVHQGAVYSPSRSAAGSVTEYGMYYGNKSRNTAGKVIKQSPAMRWRSVSLPEDEFRLEEPAIDLLEPEMVAPVPDIRRKSMDASEEVEERLRDAIAATTRANSRSNSSSSIHRSASSSRRSSMAYSNRSTPRIRPKVTGSSSADPSPMMRPYDGSDISHSSITQDEFYMKSNYQNLVDGTHQHLGLSSADRMSTDLRSKKNVHKIAEQERRNRMNTAIAELAQLLGPGDEKSLSSKASTVERAARYIKKLKRRILELEGKGGLVNSSTSTIEGDTSSSNGSPSDNNNSISPR